MPKLNRIRIANVSYDGKHIMDETYDTFGGENTLFNLANGSGKSVLVQMMLQPILPCQRIHERKIESYLSKTSSPTYIMLEWILDNIGKPVYFLSGIAMCSIAQDDETGARVKYFTFTHKYDGSNDYDIARTPLIGRVEGGYKYMPYEEAFTLLKNVKDGSLNCYARDKSEAYQKNLQEHGIFAKEWKLLARVNNREGGVDEVFADCKSSDALLNRWILKTVADKTGAEEQNLREMFLALMSSILAQEETLQEKELLSGFLSDTDKLLDALSALYKSLDDLEQIERLLAGLYAYLHKRVGGIDEEKQGCAAQEREYVEAIRHIQYEQLSASWYNAEENYLLCQKLLDERSEITKSQRIIFEQAKRDREIMEAAGYKAAIGEADAHIAALHEQLAMLKAGLTGHEAQDILFTLDRLYTEKISKNQAALQKISAEIAALEDLLQQYKEETARINDDKQEIAELLGLLRGKVAAFEEFELHCQKTLGMWIHRTLLRELSADEVVSTQKNLDDESARLVLEAEDMHGRLATDTARRDALLAGRKVLADELTNAALQLEKHRQGLEAYQAAEEKLTEIAQRRRLPALIEEIPRNLGALKENEIQRKTELAKWEAQLVYQRDTLARFNANCLHTAPAFGELLKSHGIDFITGEDYLKGLDAGQQQAALSRNPMLPFCFLVGKGDFAKATSLYSDGIDRVCPILILEKAAEDMQAGENAISLREFGRAMCYYYAESFSPVTKDSFREKLEDAIARSEKSHAEWLEELEQLKQDMAFLEGFPYHSESKQLLTAEFAAWAAARQKITEQIEQEEQEAHELEASGNRLREEIIENQRAQERSAQHLSLFAEYLIKDAAYVNDFTEQQRLTGALKELNKRYHTLNDELASGNAKLISAGIEKSAVNDLTEQLRQKHRHISAPVSGELLDWPLEALEKRYEEITAQQSQDEKNIQQQINHHGDNRDKAEKSLKKYRHIADHELEPVSYDEGRWEILEKEEKRHERLLLQAGSEQNEANKKYIRAEAERDSRRNRLQDEGWPEPLAHSEIKGDYAARRADFKHKLDGLKIKLRELDDEREKCQRDINRILRIIEKPADTAAEPPPGGWPALNIDEQSARHKKMTGELGQLREAAADIERALKSGYKGRHAGLDNVLGALSISGQELDYQACYFIFERLSEQRRLLQENVRILTSHLEHLDNQKENVVYHAFAQGKKLHAELKKISESSRVKLIADKPRQQTLKIGIPDELDAYAEERVRNHVEGCIAGMRQVKKESGLTDKIMRGIIETKLSDREILNHTIGQHNIDVRLLKVDASQANTKLRTWESVLRDNSGGELFVSCFALLSALMDYSRKSALTQDTAASGAKVMLIDNPFGKTSSTHLLDALIQVAKQFNMQMICLSDLSQSSITAKFALIYQLSVRPAMYSGKSYLKTDHLTKNAELSKDSRLEHVSLRHEQGSLFL